MKNNNFHATKIKPLIQIISRIVSKNPSIVENPDYLMATIAHSIPNFHDKTKCINCGASMAEYVFEFDVLDAILLFEMGKIVRDRIATLGSPTFTDANKVRTPDMLGVSLAVKCRTTQCAKLGLIAKYRSDNGRHLPGTWVITKRGWQALRGLPVPKQVRVFRGEILERTDTQITITEAFQNYSRKVEEKIKRKKNLKNNYIDDIQDYEPNEWVHIAGMHGGEMI